MSSTIGSAQLAVHRRMDIEVGRFGRNVAFGGKNVWIQAEKETKYSPLAFRGNILTLNL